MNQVTFRYFVYRNRGEKALQLVEREGTRDTDAKFTYVLASAKSPSRAWNAAEWTLQTSNTLRDDEKGFDVMVASFSPFVLVNEVTGEAIRICENKVTTGLPPRGKCEIPLTPELLGKTKGWFKNPVNIAA